MRLLIGAGEHEEEVRLDAAGRPPLVAVDDPLVAVFLGGRRQHFRVRPPPCIGSVIANPESISARPPTGGASAPSVRRWPRSRGCACSPRRAPHTGAPSARAGSGPPLRTPAASRGTRVRARRTPRRPAGVDPRRARASRSASMSAGGIGPRPSHSRSTGSTVSSTNSLTASAISGPRPISSYSIATLV